jgi:uncharacterized protein YdhG (YjbR/CyaY superfamily)
MTRTRYKTVDEYLAAQTPKAMGKLLEIRGAIMRAAPHAEELISYNIPAFKLKGMLVWYAGFKKHIGFYPRTSAMEAFKSELLPYKRAKGSVQFPIDTPIPLRLISKIVKYRVKENAKAALDSSK